MLFMSLSPFFFLWFRDGVSESQFNQVLNVELDQIIEVFTWPIYIFFLHASFVR